MGVMGVIVEFSVSPEDFKLGQLLCLDPNIQVVVEQLVPIGSKVMPFAWVSGDIEVFEKNISSRIEYEVVLVDDVNERKLYRLEWDEDADELIQSILRSEGAVLDAEGSKDEWNFRVRFRTREDLSEFHSYCGDNDVRTKVQRIYNPIEVSGNSRMGMTPTQARTLVDALDAGYFDIPRRTSLVEMSNMYGISDQAVSERIRRATAELIRSSLLLEGDSPVKKTEND